MADFKITEKIPAQSISYMAMCIVGLSILVLGGILPAYRTIHTLDKRITDLNRRIDDQKNLTSLFVALKEQTGQNDRAILPLPAREKLSPDKLDTIPPVFRKAAGNSGMSLVSAVPDLGALAGSAQFIPVNVVLRGNTRDFRKFILEIGAIPYIDHVEKIEVHVGPENREFRLNIQIAVG